jgi:hypothetical protein
MRLCGAQRGSLPTPTPSTLQLQLPIGTLVRRRHGHHLRGGGGVAGARHHAVLVAQRARSRRARRAHLQCMRMRACQQLLPALGIARRVQSSICASVAPCASRSRWGRCGSACRRTRRTWRRQRRRCAARRPRRPARRPAPLAAPPAAPAPPARPRTRHARTAAAAARCPRAARTTARAARPARPWSCCGARRRGRPHVSRAAAAAQAQPLRARARLTSLMTSSNGSASSAFCAARQALHTARTARTEVTNSSAGELLSADDAGISTSATAWRTGVVRAAAGDGGGRLPSGTAEEAVKPRPLRGGPPAKPPRSADAPLGDAGSGDAMLQAACGCPRRQAAAAGAKRSVRRRLTRGSRRALLAALPRGGCTTRRASAPAHAAHAVPRAGWQRR